MVITLIYNQVHSIQLTTIALNQQSEVERSVSALTTDQNYNVHWPINSQDHNDNWALSCSIKTTTSCSCFTNH